MMEGRKKPISAKIGWSFMVLHIKHSPRTSGLRKKFGTRVSQKLRLAQQCTNIRQPRLSA